MNEPELATSVISPMVWCVAEADLEVRDRYLRRKQGQPCIHPLDAEPIVASDYAPRAPLS